LREGALTHEFKARFGIDGMTDPIKVRFIRMSAALAENLDYPSKLSRHPAHIERLIADGEAQAAAFLDELHGPVAAAEPLVEGVAEHGPMGPP